MKTHLIRSERSTWCGRSLLDHHIRQNSTRNHNEADCQICLKANAAEQRKENIASA